MNQYNHVLRLVRIFHDLNQKELADELKISKSYLSEIESGKKPPTLSLLEGYATIFDIPCWVILFLCEPDPKPHKLEGILSAATFDLVCVIVHRLNQ